MNVILSLMLALMPALLGQTKPDSSVPIKDLRNAPATVVIDNRSLHLSAYPWRDFMPGNGGSPLMVAVKIASDDKQPLPSGIRMDRVWVLYGEQSWDVAVRGRIPGQDQDMLIKCPNSPVCEISVRGGPMWEPGVYVDVVLRFIDSAGKEYFLQAPNQRVKATN